MGGRIRTIPEVDLPPQIIDEELAVIKQLEVIIKLNTSVGLDISLKSIYKEFSAIYLGTGRMVNEFELPLDLQGKLKVDPVTYETGQKGVFAGGTLLREYSYSPITSLSDGRRAAISIDRYLQGVSLSAVRENEGSYPTRLFTSTQGVKPVPPVPMGNSRSFYSKHEAMQEAGRCLDCQCLECVKVCQYMTHFKGYPKNL
ncbi:hypothetical protein N752_28920 [Desulforamulus aquiferis]|nr:hypothetical protein [Desulforamulus aquiferis]RYD01601.1 hypothetical protein N752_28920 [Desulforamulus aquiferis]